MKKGYYQSPIGCFEIRGTAKGISAVQLQPGMDCYGAEIPEELTEVALQLDEYFHRKRKIFELPLDLSAGTDFNQAVWQELLKVPYGKTTSYSAIAKNLDNPDAVRAVGLSNKMNPIAIIIPCHRCLAKNGDLHDYFYGLEIKRKLLELENPMAYGEQRSLF